MTGPTLLKALSNLGSADHLCLIYENRDEQWNAAFPFIRIGLQRNEKCLYIADDNNPGIVMAAMKKAKIPVEKAIREGKLVFATKEDAYLRQGTFDPDEMIRFLASVISSSLAEGFSGLRVTAEMTWALGTEATAKRLIEYEAKLNHFFPNSRITAICQYNRNRFSPEIIKQVIHTHPIVIFGGRVNRNFYYIPPEEFLAPPSAAIETERLLNSLAEREILEEDLKTAKQLLENSSDLIVRFDADLRRIFANSAVEKQLGKSVQSILGIPFAPSEFPAGFAQTVETSLKTVLKTGKPLVVEAVAPTPHGERTFHTKIIPEFNEQNEVTSLLAVSRDISDLVASTAALERSEQFLRIVLDSFGHPFSVIDAETCRVLLANKVLIQELPENAKCFTLTHGRSRPCSGTNHACPLMEMRKDPRPIIVEHTHVNQSGEEITVEVRAYPIFDSGGKLSQIIECNLDVTEQKRMADALQWEASLNACLAALGKEILSPQLDIMGLAEIVVGYAKFITKSSVGFISLNGKAGTDEFAIYVPRKKSRKNPVVRRKTLHSIFRKISPAHPLRHLLRTQSAEGVYNRSTLIRGEKVPHPTGIRNFLFLPLPLTKNHSMKLILWNSPKEFAKKDMDAVRRMCEILSLALLRKESEDENLRLNQDLELLVEIRTAQLHSALAELQHSNQELKALSEHLRKIREEEHAKFSRILHDDIGQLLSGLNVDITWFAAQVKKSADFPTQKNLAKRISEAKETVREALDKARTLALELRPHVLANLGLIPAIEWQLKNFQQRNDIPCHLQCSPQTFELPHEIDLILFRVLQEALTNIARHAKASHVIVKLLKGKKTCTMEIKDTGQGFDLQKIEKPKSLGILSMRAGPEEYGGNLEIISRKDRGTTVRVTIPIGEALS
jgi:signal transduction histidine kinase